MCLTPPKPIHLMTSAEKQMWDLEVQFKVMQEDMKRKEREMMEMFQKKREVALQLKQEEDRKERERLERERLEKERLERERIERLEKERLERLEKERLEKERLEKER
jgi:hypothetical protein